MLTKIVILSSTAISIDLTESLSQSSEYQCHLLYSHLSQSLIFTAISYESFDIVHACGSWNLSNSNKFLTHSAPKKSKHGGLVLVHDGTWSTVLLHNSLRDCFASELWVDDAGSSLGLGKATSISVSQLISTYWESLLSILKCVTYWSTFSWVDSFFRKCQSQLCRVLHPKSDTVTIKLGL